jgi:hypothetical protein
MTIPPSLFEQTSFLKLQSIAGKDALWALVKLHLHCENRLECRFWPDATAEALETLCDWKGEPGALFASLVRFRWIMVMEACLDKHPDGRVTYFGPGVLVRRLADWPESCAPTCETFRPQPSRIPAPEISSTNTRNPV